MDKVTYFTRWSQNQAIHGAELSVKFLGFQYFMTHLVPTLVRVRTYIHTHSKVQRRLKSFFQNIETTI